MSWDGSQLNERETLPKFIFNKKARNTFLYPKSINNICTK